jgi:predicted RNase H-like HicB family nuclease
MKRPFSATVWRESDWWVSQCLDVDIASQGSTEEEALANLREALKLHFEPPVATQYPAVRRIELDRESRLRLFDQATERQTLLVMAPPLAEPPERGWSRGDLYGR